MNILLITEFFPRGKLLRFTGGVEARAFYLYQELQKDHHVTVISRPPKSIAATPWSLTPRIIFFFKSIISSFKIQAAVVEGSNFVTYLSAFIIGKIKSIPAVAWYPDVFIGTWKNKFGLIGQMGELIERLTLKLPWSHVIALSHQTQKKLIASGINPDKITVVYPGVNTQVIKEIAANKFKKPTVCCISRLVKYKRVADLIAAFSLVCKKIPHSRLIIIGSGPEENNLHNLAKDLNLKSNIIWKKNLSRTKLLKTLKSSHLHCLPSVVEGFGLVTLEALAAGVPYVNASTDINLEITHSGMGGLLYQPQSSSDLSSKIIQILKNKKLYAKKVREGQNLIKQYSWKNSANQTLQIYQSVLNKN